MSDSIDLDRARRLINDLLQGASPDGVDPARLGPYQECYQEMVRAYSGDGTAALRKAFEQYAQHDAALAALIAGDHDPDQHIDVSQNGHPTSLPTIVETVGRALREVNAAALRSKWAAGGGIKMNHLPFLGQAGYIAKGWSHLLAAYPKVGKTELLADLCMEWRNEKVLYFTEEPESVWGDRLQRFSNTCEHITLVFVLGDDAETIRTRIQKGKETVVVIDTVRNLLPMRDETNNSEVARILIPLIATCRSDEKTLIMSHHLRKGGGEHGEGITGGHAFLGVVDRALEITRVGDNLSSRRKVQTWGRIFSTPDLLYELQDGQFVALGDPSALALQEVKARLLAAMSDELRTQKEILNSLDEPKPSAEQTRLVLEKLRQEGAIERDPPEGGQGKTHRFRLVPTSLPTMGSYMGSEVEDRE